mmetsp:Transcript_48263/g.75374  ORF Transcript_48263/g.75374 Transcript_48263/m.75374 type:complete len:305 (-) Transcript_48263:328-1242(-)
MRMGTPPRCWHRPKRRSWRRPSERSGERKHTRTESSSWSTRWDPRTTPTVPSTTRSAFTTPTRSSPRRSGSQTLGVSRRSQTRPARGTSLSLRKSTSNDGTRHTRRLCRWSLRIELRIDFDDCKSGTNLGLCISYSYRKAAKELEIQDPAPLSPCLVKPSCQFQKGALCLVFDSRELLYHWSKLIQVLGCLLRCPATLLFSKLHLRQIFAELEVPRHALNLGSQESLHILEQLRLIVPNAIATFVVISCVITRGGSATRTPALDSLLTKPDPLLLCGDQRNCKSHPVRSSNTPNPVNVVLLCVG